jgi:hypothetical protein
VALDEAAIAASSNNAILQLLIFTDCRISKPGQLLVKD